MSPIIKEPDGTEQIPVDPAGETPFPEDITAGSVNPSKPDETTDNFDQLDSSSQAAGVPKKDSNKLVNLDKRHLGAKPLGKKLNKNQDKSSSLKRSQSLKIRNDSKTSFQEKNIPNSCDDNKVDVEGKDSLSPLGKQNKFNFFKNRFTMFPKTLSNEDIKDNDKKKGYKLKRSQSMKVSSKDHEIRSSVPDITKKRVETSKNSNNDIQNSRSMVEIVDRSKKRVTSPSKIILDGKVKSNMKGARDISLHNLTTSSSKLKSKINTNEKEPKNFAHKTIDALRKSVQGKLKGNVEKQDRNNEVSKKKVSKIVTNASKDEIKSNYKRKKNDHNDSDPEIKPKKMASSNLKSKAKARETLTSSSRTKVRSKDINSKKSDGKSNLKSNKKKVKSNKDILLNIKNKEHNNGYDVITNKNISKDINEDHLKSIKTCIHSSVSAMQNHHALFLNNIHETFNNSYKSKYSDDTKINLNDYKHQLPEPNKLPESLIKSFYAITTSDFSHSLPYLHSEYDKKENNIMSFQSDESSLVRSHSDTCISERSLSMSVHECDMKSSSPMSVSHCDDERIKVDRNSPMSFANYDPYIDENMDYYLYEGEGDEESYFGTLFKESKLMWDSFSDSFHDIEQDLSDHFFNIPNNRVDEFIVNCDQSEGVKELLPDLDVILDLSAVKESLPNNGGGLMNEITSKDLVQERNLKPSSIKEMPKLNHSKTKNLKDIKKYPLNGNKNSPKDVGNKSKGKINNDKKIVNTSMDIKSTDNDTTSDLDKALKRKVSMNEQKTKHSGLKNSKKQNPNNSTNKKLKESTTEKDLDEGRLILDQKSKIMKEKALNEICISRNGNEELSLRKEKTGIEIPMHGTKEKTIELHAMKEKTGQLQITKEKTGTELQLQETKEHLNEEAESKVLGKRNETNEEKKDENAETKTRKKEQDKRGNLMSSTGLSHPKIGDTKLVSNPKKSGSAASGGLPGTPGVRTPARERIIRPLPSRAVSRLSTSSNTTATPDINEEKKRHDLSLSAAAGRRSKIDTGKTPSVPKNSRAGALRTKQTDPVKVLRPTTQNGGPAPHLQLPPHVSDQLKRLEAELSARTQEAQVAREETARTNRGLEALTVLVHYLTEEYDAFSTPKFKAQVEKLTTQLTDVRLSLDESTATARRLENEATERCQKQVEELRSLEEAHKEEISGIAVEHQTKIEEVLEKHENELQEVIGKEEIKREELVKTQKEEIERLEAEWRAELDKQHDRHLQALEQLNSCHKQQLQDAEMSWRSREKEIEESNAKLMKEQNALKQQAKRLEETLLSDKDHRLQAAKRLCTALQNEVDSLKTVVDMRNSEVHKLRDQLADKEKISEELDAARDRVRALQAKTEDLHAQMEQKLQLERQLMADRHSLSDSLQREASVNKRLSLENEELQWKLRQREASPSNNISTPTIDMVTRCSTGLARQNEGCKTGSVSPQFTPRSQRIGTKPHDKKWSQSFSNIPEDAKRVLRRTDLQHDDIAIESPPPSPRVKGVIEKSNSVSFILDLNDTYQGDSFLGNQSSQVGKKPRTPSMQRKPLAKSFTNCIEKSRSASLVQPSSKSNFFHQEVSNKSSKSKGNDTENENFNGQASIDGESRNGMSLNASKYSRKHSTSESSDSGDIERISPTGLSWTVPVHSNSKRYSKSMTNSRFQLVPETPRLLQQPDEDEYEEPENEFVEVLALSEDLNSAPLTMLFAQTPSTSVSLSDSDVSQCGSRGDLSSEDDEDDEGTLLQKETQCRPQEGAGEAMIFPDVFDLKGNGKKGISKSQISSAPSSDSEDANQTTNEEGALNMSWSEDVECDLTSSSEMQELQLL